MYEDLAAGVRERAFFFGDGPDRLFGCSYEPPGEPLAGVIVCCPLQAELLRNYRREVLLARTLAARGVAVQRFHYRGSGHSDGDTAHATFGSMRDDALTAARELVARTGAPAISFVGARWGGLVAAAAAAVHQAPVVLWEPVTEPERYFEEILRFRLMYEMKEDPSTTVSHSTLVDELMTAGSVDVLGHTIERTMYDSAREVSLRAVVAPSTPALLLVQMAIGRTLRREYERLAEAWRGDGIDVETHVIPDREAWWLSGDLWPVHETHQPTTALIAATADWVVGRAGARRGP